MEDVPFKQILQLPHIYFPPLFHILVCPVVSLFCSLVFSAWDSRVFCLFSRPLIIIITVIRQDLGFTCCLGTIYKCWFKYSKFQCAGFSGIEQWHCKQTNWIPGHLSPSSNRKRETTVAAELTKNNSCGYYIPFLDPSKCYTLDLLNTSFIFFYFKLKTEINFSHPALIVFCKISQMS